MSDIDSPDVSSLDVDEAAAILPVVSQSSSFPESLQQAPKTRRPIFHTLPESVSPDTLRPINLTRAKVSRDYATLSRKIGRGCHIRLPALAPDAVLALYLTDAAAVEWIDPVVLAGSFGAIEFAQGTRFVRSVCGIDLGEQANADTEVMEWLHAAVLGRLHDTPFACADRLERSALTTIQDATALSMVLRTGGHAVTLHARAAISSWLAFLQQAMWERERLPTREYRDLPFGVRVRIARHVLPANALRALTPGDILLPETVRFTCDGEGVVQLGGLSAKVRYQAPSMLEVIDVGGKMEHDDFEGDDQDGYMEEEGEHPEGFEDEEHEDEYGDEHAEGGASSTGQHAGGAADREDSPVLDQVPVAISFELGHLRLSLSELRTLGPGVVLSVEGGSPASIAIVASGRTLGRGEVVDVNGQLGIRIVHWGQPL